MSRQFPVLMVSSGLALLLCSGAAQSGTFLQFNNRPANQVVHPQGYNGTGGTLPVRVCLDPAARPASGDPAQSFRNAMATFNRNQPVLGNVVVNPGGAADFESVLLHEVGHCLGMGHSAVGPSEQAAAGATEAARYYANVQTGGNGVLNTDAGADARRGSRDDVRGDDVNISWFRKGVNNPFELPPATVDRVTHSVSLGDLPIGHAFAEISTSFAPCSPSSANTSSLRGQPATQNIMFPVICTNNHVRNLAPADVTLLRVARAGRDGVQGTVDDYTPQLQYVGETTSGCDIVVRFSAGAGFAFCSVGGVGISGSSDIAISSAEVRFERTVNWQFNQQDTTGTPTAESDLSLSKGSTSTTAVPGETVTFSIQVQNLGSIAVNDVLVTDPTPAGMSFVANSGACTTAFPCALGTLGAGGSATINASFRVDDGTAPGTVLTNTASVSGGVSDPSPGNNSDGHSITVQAAPGADLEVSKVASAQTGSFGDTVTFDVTITNNGSGVATGVTAEDWGAAGFAFVSNTGDCVTAYPCDLGVLAPSSSVSFTSTYTIDVAPSGSDWTMLTHTVSSSSSVGDPDPGNNSAVNSVQVVDPDHLFGSSFE
ncbi:DUF7507 domain-containing protein [Pseudomarimonas salicorniae]|uniref:DUF11 domain-containing protein n=1 Tax=Pseudomarimonas salicorniae TaxID=2933270 RepID=A0ABT0GKB7_9GAMM|nr:hypothetical protein [Lysobacter sp. CAU 1642]MCK7594492.1 hypothetical protein [Lysobacter sp. CAU 1642]